MQLHVQSNSKDQKKWETNLGPRSELGSDMAWNSMLAEDVKNEELCKLLRCNHIMSWNEESLLGEMINNDQYSGITGR